MIITKVVVTRNVKVSAGNYENSDTTVTLEASCRLKDATDAIKTLESQIDGVLAVRLEQVHKFNKSRQNNFGVK